MSPNDTKPVFDPTKPYQTEEAKPAEKKPVFDTSKPYSVLDEQTGQMLPEVPEMTKEQAQEIFNKSGDPFQGTAKIIWRGAGQGMSLGAIDEMVGVAGGIRNVLQSGGEQPFFAFRKGYKADKKQYEALDLLAQKANPAAFTTGMLGGTAATFMLPGPKQLNPAHAKTFAGLLKGSAVAGAMIGFNTSDADLFAGEYEKALLDATAGSAINVAIPSGMKSLAPLVKKSVASLKKTAGQRAVKAAIGNQAKFMDPIVRKGQEQEVGNILMKEGVVAFGDKAADISKKAAAKADETGKKIGEILLRVDEEVPATVNGNEIAEEILEFAVSKEAPNNKSFIANLIDQASDYSKRGMMSLGEAQRLKMAYKWDAREPAALALGKEATNKINLILSKNIERGVKSAEKLIDNPGSMAALDEFKAAKKTFGAVKQAQLASEKLASRQAKNRSISLTDYMAGGTAAIGLTASGGNPVIAIGAVLGNKLLRERGSSAAAKTALALSKFLDDATNVVAKDIMSSKWGITLREAAKKGQAQLGATHALLLNTDDEYRQEITRMLQSVPISDGGLGMPADTGMQLPAQNPSILPKGQ